MALLLFTVGVGLAVAAGSERVPLGSLVLAVTDPAPLEPAPTPAR